MTQDGLNIMGYNRAAAVDLVKGGLNPLVAVLLASRNIQCIEEARELTEDRNVIADPFLLDDIEKAVARIKLALERGEHIAIYGDYDVDGMTSSSLLASYFKAKGVNCDIYIPERIGDGYGVKNKAVDTLHERGVSLVITVDCGITAIEETEYAKTLGMDIVITDHHECGEVLPAAVAVINPKRPGCRYPEKMLAGVGVAFKLVCALEGGSHADELFAQYGDLVAIGTVADVVPVLGENRTFIRRGIAQMREKARPGIKKLCEASGIDLKKITSSGIGFTLAPRLNAAGRLGQTMRAVELLLTENEDEAEIMASEMCELNRERQALEGKIFEEAAVMLADDRDSKDPIVLAEETWHQGVTGIVASRLAERLSRPAVMICLQDGKGRGSCRSFGSFNIFEALEANKDILESFGGHEMAAGLTIPEENITVFRERLRAFYREKIAGMPEPALSVDFEVLKPGLLTEENVASLSLLEPYGNGNPTPVLYMENAEVDIIMPISSGRHTKMWVKKYGESFECVYFSKTTKELKVTAGNRVDIVFTPQINEFRGRRTVQLLLQKVAVHRG